MTVPATGIRAPHASSHAVMTAPLLPYHDVVLDNGLLVTIVPQPTVHRAVAALYLRVGSRFETPENNGISHFLEHMVFRGTASKFLGGTATDMTPWSTWVAA